MIYYFLWNSIFTYSGEEIIKGFTINSMILYYVISMIVATITYCEIDSWIGEDIRSGDVITSFLFPIKFIKNYMGFQFGLTVISFLSQVIPAVLIGIFFFSLNLPGLFYTTSFVISLIIAIGINYLFAFLIGLSAFWFNKIGGIIKIKRVLLSFLSGGLIPLTFFPEIAQKISNFLPFQYMRFIPITIYLKNYTHTQTIIHLIIGVSWLVIIYVMSELVFKQAFKKFAGAGV